MSRRHPMVPVAPPYAIDNFYSPDEVDALFGVIKEHGPWPPDHCHAWREVRNDQQHVVQHFGSLTPLCSGPATTSGH